jgi:hypothetical protein
MTHSRTLRFGAILALGATAAVTLAAVASARQIVRQPVHEEFTEIIENFCDVPGLTVRHAFVLDGREQAVGHGPDGVAYFLHRTTVTNVFTNLANGKSIHDASNVLDKDLRITDNGDGTLTILGLSTGNTVLYGENGKAIARNPGQVRYEFLIDDGGTPADPFDDEFLADLGLVKGSTGRTDDFCAAAVPALS